MRVLIHCDQYYPTAQAGSYRMQAFVDSFLATGDDVTVVTSSANKANGTADLHGHPEKIIYSPAIRMKKKTTLMRMLNSLSFGVTSVFSSLGAGKADVVITTSPPPTSSFPGWIIAKFKNARLVYDVRDIWPDVAVEMGSFGENSFYFKVFDRISRFMYKHADIITVVSPGKVEKIKAHLRSCANGGSSSGDAEKIWLVGNGFDESVTKSEFDQEIVDKYGLDEKFTCVFIGNIGLAQGLGALLDIAAGTKHRDVQFLCFGTGAEQEMLEKRVRDEGLTNVRFCGRIGHDKVLSVLSRAGISFIPLKNGSMKDSVPTKTFEALGLGCPVFLVAEGDACDLIDEAGLGVHVSPDDADRIVEAFDDMIDRYDDICTCREKAVRLMLEKYSRQKISDVFNKRLHQLCGK